MGEGSLLSTAEPGKVQSPTLGTSPGAAMGHHRRPAALSPVLLEGESHVLLHLLQAVVVGVDEVERQGHGERAVPPAWRHP